MSSTSAAQRLSLLLPIFDLLGEQRAIFEQSEANFAAMPRRLKDQIANRRPTSIEDFFVFLMFMDPEHRREHMNRIGSLMEALDQLIEIERLGGDDGPLFERSEMDMVTDFLLLLTKVRGTRNRRELRRFFDAMKAEDVSYLVVKCEAPKGSKPSEIHPRFAHHISTDTLRQVHLTGPEDHRSAVEG